MTYAVVKAGKGLDLISAVALLLERPNLSLNFSPRIGVLIDMGTVIRHYGDFGGRCGQRHFNCENGEEEIRSIFENPIDAEDAR